MTTVGGHNNGTAMTTYFAIFHKDSDSAVGVVFPDLPGCFAAGEDYDEAIEQTQKALADYAETQKSAGRNLPKPRSFETLFGDADIRDEAAGSPFIGISLVAAKNTTRIGAMRSADKFASIPTGEAKKKDTRKA